MAVTSAEVSAGIRRLDLAAMPLCVHSSLRSFGRVQGGAPAVIEGILREGCTLMVPSFTSFNTAPPPGRSIPRNGSDPAYLSQLEHRTNGVPTFDAASTAIDADMGTLPATVVRMPGRRRGRHPLNSFSAVGAMADRLIQGQRPLDVYAPLRTLSELGGCALLMGVDFTALTLIHLAEHMAGRSVFRRWAKDGSGRIIECQAGGCSDGFQRLAPFVSDVARSTAVGLSTWVALPARATLDRLSAVIRADPAVTHCGDAACERCNDAVLGGPILDGPGAGRPRP